MPFNLGNDFFIERIDKHKDIEPLLEKARTLSEYGRRQVMDFSTYAIVKRYAASSIEATHLYETKIYQAMEETKSLIKMAFGLAKGTNMTFPTFHIRDKDSSALVSTSYDDRPPRWHYTGVTFDPEDLLTVRLLIKKIQPLSTETHDRIMNACIYFETGRLSYEYIVRFVTLISAIESLFNSSTEHISETIALRCASMLDGNKNEKFDFYRRLKDVYKMRSYLVHGQDIPKRFKARDAQKRLISDVELFARQSLLHIFRNNNESVFKLKESDFNEHFARRLL